jgi:hypothetical protein
MRAYAPTSRSASARRRLPPTAFDRLKDARSALLLGRRFPAAAQRVEQMSQEPHSCEATHKPAGASPPA